MLLFYKAMVLLPTLPTLKGFASKTPLPHPLFRMVPLFASIGGGDTLSPLEEGNDFPSKKGGPISLLWGVG